MIIPGNYQNKILNFFIYSFLGLIDINTSIQDFRETSWEGIEHGTMAACAGGVTTILD
jgi:dihydroorotase-like cyclic amidohydrolase